MSEDKPLVYMILGATGSGRRAVLLDLIDDGLAPDAVHVILVNDGESSDPADEQFPALGSWLWTCSTIEADITTDVTHVFLISDGRVDPVDQLEALKPWVVQQDAELARIITVVNCQLGESHSAVLAWYDACVHFSDVILLNKREGVANKWISDFQARYRNQWLPCLMEFVKAGRVKSASVVLDPIARRLSHYFDEEQDWVISGAVNEDEAEGDEEIEVKMEEDPYFERHGEGDGRRMKEIPDIRKYLDAAE